MKAWKKHNPKSIFLNIFGIPLDPNQSLFEIGSVAKEPSKLAFRPIGGSFVILTPFCKTATGNV